MIVAYIKIASWDSQPIRVAQKRGGTNLSLNDYQPGDQVIVKTDLGLDLGKISKIEEVKEEKLEGFILRKANKSDIESYNKKNNPDFKNKSIKKCQKIVENHDLPMKIIDALLSFDGGRITFAFTAPKRVDFRKAVKELASVFHKSIRMHQVGVRQVAKSLGGIGPCGRQVCCAQFLDDIKSVTTEAIKNQRLSHRGPERLTGLCGRLKCCLLYEEEAYKELIKKFPPIGSKVKTKLGKGIVVDWRILKNKVIIKRKKNKNQARIEVDLEDIKK